MSTDFPVFLPVGAFRWRELGYSFQLDVPLRLRDLDASGQPEPWLVLLAVFEEARAGQFANLHRAVDCMLQASDWALLRAAAELLGNAGTSACLKDALQRLRSEIFDSRDVALQVEFCRSLWCSHLLWTAPVIAKIFTEIEDHGEAEIVSIHLARLLGSSSNWQVGGLELDGVAFEEEVRRRYGALRAIRGDDEIPVLEGEVYSVKKMAVDFLAMLKSERDLMEADFFGFRQKFEAATGIDCAGMFSAGVPQPLVAAGIVEGFLEGAAVQGYRPGVRYFFGHEIR